MNGSVDLICGMHQKLDPGTNHLWYAILLSSQHNLLLCTQVRRLEVLTNAPNVVRSAIWTQMAFVGKTAVPARRRSFGHESRNGSLRPAEIVFESA